MTTTLTDQPRRQSASAPRPPRELPVLFHLLDVSRPRGYTTKPEEPPRSYSFQPASSSLLAESIALNPVGLHQASDLATPPAEAAQAGIEDADSLSSGLEHEPIDSAPESSLAGEAGAGEDAVASETASSAVLETPSPATDDAVALRHRVEERQRKRHTAANDDWFGSHGKYIAIGFVLALLATIYAARSQRKSAPPAVAKPPHVHKHETPGSSIRAASAEGSTQGGSATRSAVAITSVGPSQNSAGESQAALHPPTIPQLASQAESSPASDGLFPWANREQERLASRTGEGRSPAAATAAPPPAVEQHSYPSTPYPGDYRQPPAPAISTQQPAPSSQPLYPTTNSPSGIRHERSGSGFH